MTEKLPIEYQFTNYSNIYLSYRQRSQKVNDSRTGEFLLLFHVRKLAMNEQMDRRFMLMIIFWAQGVVCPRAIYMYMYMTKIFKHLFH